MSSLVFNRTRHSSDALKTGLKPPLNNPGGGGGGDDGGGGGDDETMMGHGGALVETMTFNRRVVGSTPALAAT